MAGSLGGTRPTSDRPARHVAAQVLPADDVRLPLGRPAHRALVRQDSDRRHQPLPAHERLERLLPGWLRRVRAAGGERGHQGRHAAARVDHGQHRQDAASAALHGRDVRLVQRGRDLRARLLPLEPVVLPQVPGKGARLSRHGPRRLVPEGPGRAGARAGRGREPGLLALRHARHQARPGAVVLQDHEVRGRTAGSFHHRMARACARHADQLDRAIRGRRGSLHDRPVGPSRRRRGVARLHDPPGHAVRCHVHGPGARTHTGGTADRARSEDRGRRLHLPVASRVGDRAPVDQPREDGRVAGFRRDQPGQRRAHPDLHRRLRAVRLRHRRDHGRARARRARLRVRKAVRAGDPSGGRRTGNRRRRRAVRGLRRAHARRAARQLGPLLGHAGAGGRPRHHGRPRVAGPGPRNRHLPPA